MKVIVGLGNPGRQYEYTRHNIGFLAIDYLSRCLDASLDQKKFKGMFVTSIHQGQKFALLKPMTYMNRSGEAIQELLHFYQLNQEDLLIIHDDLDLPSGKIKLRIKGGSAGHNGLKSIINHLNTEQFKRIKMGIGRPEYGDVVSYVLGPFPKEEEETTAKMIKKAAEASQAFLEEDDFSKVMNRFNV